MIPFSTEAEVSLLEVESVQAMPIDVEQVQAGMIELDAGFGSSLYQALQDYITLDGGRAGDMFTNITPLDGGTA